MTLTRNDLLSLETYAQQRAQFRTHAIARKKQRTVHIGDHLTAIFEDRLSVQYQVQEMLRIERIFEAEGIQEELDAYNPLIPDGSNLKATLLVEYADVDERKRELARLRGLEHAITLTVHGHAAVTAIADEDMQRSNADKTSAVHFLRFELSPGMIDAWRAGAGVQLASTLPALTISVALTAAQRAMLATDFHPSAP